MARNRLAPAFLFIFVPLVASAASGTLVYSTYVGSASGTNSAAGMAVDASGKVTVAGNTQSSSPNTQLTFLSTVNADGSSAGFITSIPPANTSQTATALVLDSAGNRVVAGYTASGSFVDKLDSTGNQLFAVGFAGAALALAIDSNNNIYVTGAAQTGLQTTSGVLQASNAGGYDAFVVKLNSSGTVVYATYLGGSDDDFGYAIAVDSAGNAYVTGSTASANFPLRNAAQPAFGGIIPVLAESSYGDAFLTKLDPNGATLVYSTYWGGAQADLAYGIALDAAGNAYIAGATQSTNFPVTAGAYQTTYAGGTPPSEPDPDGDAFVAKFGPNGASAWSTYFGGSSRDGAMAIALDANGNVYIAGTTESSDLPATANALPSCRTDGRPFLAEFDSSGATLLNATGLPGLGYDQALALAVNSTGVYMAGLARSQAFFTYGATSQKVYSGGTSDGFVAKLNLAASPGLFPACVLNAASLLAGNEGNFFDGSVAPGEIVSVFGLGVGPAAPTDLQLTASGTVSTILGGIQVLFDGIPAPLLYGAATQLNAVVPYGIDTSATHMTVMAPGGVMSDSILMPVAPAVPAIFTLNEIGQGQAAVYNQDFTVNSVQNPAARGTYVMVYAEGAGLMSPAMGDGWVAPGTLPLPAPNLPVTATVRGVSTSTNYVGAAPNFVSGALQVNVLIPTSIDFGDSVPLFLSVGGFTTQYNVTIAVK